MEKESEQKILRTVMVWEIYFPGVYVSLKCVSTDDESIEEAMEFETS